MICECGGTDFQFVYSGEKEFRHIDYVPHIILGRGEGIAIKAVFCKNCGVVQNVTTPNGKILQKKDIVAYFKQQYRERDREEKLKKVILMLKYNFSHFVGRDKEEVFKEILYSHSFVGKNYEHRIKLQRMDF